jgi:hypothetical protein
MELLPALKLSWLNGWIPSAQPLVETGHPLVLAPRCRRRAAPVRWKRLLAAVRLHGGLDTRLPDAWQQAITHLTGIIHIASQLGL